MNTNGVLGMLQDCLSTARALQQGGATPAQINDLAASLQLATQAATIARGKDSESFRRKSSDVLRALPSRWVRVNGNQTGASNTALPPNRVSAAFPVTWPLPGIVVGYTAGTTLMSPQSLGEMSLRITKESTTELIFDAASSGAAFIPFASIVTSASNISGWQPCEHIVTPNMSWQIYFQNEAATATYTPWAVLAVIEFPSSTRV